MVPAGSLVLLLTGWSGRWRDPGAYLGTDAAGQLHFPGFGLNAADLLLNERGVAGLGTDTPGLEPGIDSDLSVSRLVLSQPRIALENLANLDLLPSAGATVVIGVLKLAGRQRKPGSSDCPHTLRRHIGAHCRAPLLDCHVQLFS